MGFFSQQNSISSWWNRAKTSTPMSDPQLDGVDLAIFDVDHTLVDGSTGFLFAKYMAKHGYIPRHYVLVAGWWLLGHRLGFVNIETMMQGGAGLFEGMSRGFIEDSTNQAFLRYIKPRIVPQISGLIELYRQREVPTLLLSGSGDQMVARIARELDVPAYISNQLGMDGDTATGRMLKPYAYGLGKLIYLREYLADKGIDRANCAAFADSQSDLPLLSFVGYPHAVNPDRRLLSTATARGWPILPFN